MESGPNGNGEYSKLEKDFLGNERMVHFDASGKVIGASEVIREADGTFRVGVPAPFEPPSVTAQPTDYLAPDSKGPSRTQELLDQSSNSNSKTYSTGTIATWGIAAFVGTVILVLLLVNVMKGGSSNGNTSGGGTTLRSSESVTPVPYPDQTEQEPDRTPDSPIFEDRRPDDPTEDRGNPVPLRDERSEPSPPVEDLDDQNPGSPKRNDRPKREPKVDPPASNDNGDPIDLRGDGGGVPPPSGDNAPLSPEDIR